LQALRRTYRAVVPERTRAGVRALLQNISARFSSRSIPWRWIEAASLLRPIRVVRGSAVAAAPSTQSLDELVAQHFARHSTPDHINRVSLHAALGLLEGKPARIFETGSSAWGTNSSRLFDSYVRRFGGEFCTVDIRSKPASILRRGMAPTTTMLVGDSVRAIRELAAKQVEPFDFVYLDSFDLDVADPVPAMVHGLSEFLSLTPLFKVGTVILIDDTPRDWDEWRKLGDTSGAERRSPVLPGLVPGKGALVRHTLDTSRFQVIHHGYQLLVRKTA
jgi:hypothetical protein